MHFGLVVGRDFNWTIIDESESGTWVNGVNLVSPSVQQRHFEQGNRPKSRIASKVLRLDSPNEIQVCKSALWFNLHTLGDPKENFDDKALHCRPLPKPLPPPAILLKPQEVYRLKIFTELRNLTKGRQAHLWRLGQDQESASDFGNSSSCAHLVG